MTFLKQFHDHVVARLRPSAAPDVHRVPAALPSIELHVPVSFRRLADTAQPDVISHPGLSAPAPMPTIGAAIPTDTPGPPPARYLTKRPAPPDAY